MTFPEPTQPAADLREVLVRYLDWLRGRVHAGRPYAVLVEQARQQAASSSAVIARHDLAERGRPGPRWDGAEPATLERVLLHLIQEYARHLGQLDVVVELAGGQVGE